MILWTTILDRIEKVNTSDTQPDIRYLERWFNNYPECFPKFMLKGKYNIHFNNVLLRYEIYKI
jgi:hypothetical protein